MTLHPLRWTKRLPSMPGWYWHRSPNGIGYSLVSVESLDNIFQQSNLATAALPFEQAAGRFIFRKIGSINCYKCCDGEWAGPIDIPMPEI